MSNALRNEIRALRNSYLTACDRATPADFENAVLDSMRRAGVTRPDFLVTRRNHARLVVEQATA